MSSLKFLGTGSAFNVEDGNTSAYLVDGKRLILIDCGGTVFQSLVRNRLLEDIGQVVVFITHMHPDHVGSLGDLIFYLAHKKGIRPIICHPEVDKVRQLLCLMGVREDYYEALSQPETSWNIRFLRQEHSETVDAYGLLFEGQFFYSGDSRSLNEEALELLQQGALGAYYQDCCSYQLQGAGHMYYGDLKGKVPSGLREHFVLMHLDEDFDKEAAMKDGFRIAK